MPHIKYKLFKEELLLQYQKLRQFGICFFINQNHEDGEAEQQVASSVPTVTEIMIVLVTGSSPPKHESYVLEGNLPFET